MQEKPHQPDFVLLFAILLLTGLGIVTVYSASTVMALHNHQSADHYAVRQLGAGLFGIALLFGMAYLPYQKWYRYSPMALFLNAILLVAVLIPHVGVEGQYGNVRRWLGTSTIDFQPSELAILTLALYLAFFFTKKITVIDSFKRGVRPALLVILLMATLIMLEPDMGTTMTLVATAVVVVIASGVNLKPVIVLIAAGVPAAFLTAKFASYRSARLTSFLHPFHDASGQGYQVIQGMTALASGGWFGRGFDMSVAKLGWLPIPQADFIFAVFTEEWGFIGAAALIVVFGVVAWRGFRIARYSKDRFGALVAVGVTSMLIIKAVINFGAVTWLLPVTGIPLPFISYGGTSLIVNLFAAGILLSVSRSTLEYQPEVDELADVVYATERFQKQAEEKSSSSDKEPKLRPAKVQSMKRTSPTPGGGWRARQEQAVARERKPVPKKTPTQKIPASSGYGTWRDRNGSRSTTKPSKTTKGPRK